MISIMLNGSGSFSMMSSTIDFTFSSLKHGCRKAYFDTLTCILCQRWRTESCKKRYPLFCPIFHIDRIHNRDTLGMLNKHFQPNFQPGCRRSPAGAPLPRLQLEHGPEQFLRGGRQESDLGVGVQSVEHGRLRRQVVRDVAVVALVVHARRAVEGRR